MAENNLEYAFNWLTENENNKLFDLIQQHVQSVNPILGAIKFEFYDCTKGTMPQKYQSAWDGVKKLAGSSYKPLMNSSRN